MGMLERFGKSVGVARNHHQMNMVRHHTVADQRGMMLFNVFPQQFQIQFPVWIAVQDKLPRISTLGHVMRNIDGNHPGESCHVPSSQDQGFYQKRRTNSIAHRYTTAADATLAGNRGIYGRGGGIRTPDPLLPKRKPSFIPTYYHFPLCSTKVLIRMVLSKENGNP